MTSRPTGIVTALLLLFLAACSGGERPAEPAAADTTMADTTSAAPAEAELDTVAVSDTAQVVVEEFSYTQEPDGGRYFTGVLSNPTPRDIRRAEVIVTLLDETNRAAGTEQIQVEAIPSGRKRPFRAPVEAGGDFQRARVRSVLVN